MATPVEPGEVHTEDRVVAFVQGLRLYGCRAVRDSMASPEVRGHVGCARGRTPRAKNGNVPCVPNFGR